MSTYENAPATKLLSTHCACCGRALVDAVSVERGIGPECAERYGAPEAQGEADWTVVMATLDGIVSVSDVNPEMTERDAANKLVHFVAKTRKDLDLENATSIFRAIAALGFTVLADRIAKRFHATIERCTEHTDCKLCPALAMSCAIDTKKRAEAAARAASPEVLRLRAEYAKIRNEFCYDACEAALFTDLVKREVGANATPEEYVAVAKTITVRCPACSGTGAYHGHSNGRGDGECFRCSGKGEQNLSDVRRNRAYDARRGGRRAA